MRFRNLSAAVAAMMVCGAALAAKPRPEIDMTDGERKTPPPPERAPVPTNLPGETNRQFAARMASTPPVKTGEG